MSESIFEKIAKKEIPSYMVWEDDDFMAFLTIGPFAEGHTLVVPKENWGDYLFDLSPEKYQALMLATKEVAKLLKAKIECDRILTWVEGFEVPHVHVHLIPAKKGFGFRQMELREFSHEEFEETRKKIVN